MKAKLLLIALILGAAATMAQVPEFWYLDEVNPGQDITLYPDGANVQDGTFACKMTLEQPEVPYLISDNFAVNAGDAYTFTIYFFDNDDRGTLKFYADFYDAEGNGIDGLDPVESTDAGEWQELTWSGTVPDDAVHGYILVKFYDDEAYVDEAVAWVDNVHFTVNDENLVLNGSFESWPGVGVDEAAAGSTVSVYPNPAAGVVQVSGQEKMDVVELRNVLGQLVQRHQGDGRSGFSFDVSGLDEGLYFVSVYEDGKVVGSAKVLKR